MQFRIFNKNFLLKAFLKYFYICSAEHSCAKIQCRWRTGLPRTITAPVCVKEISAFGAAACTVLFRDEASGGAINARTVCFHWGMFSDSDHPDFIHHLKVSGIEAHRWESSMNIFCMYRGAFLRGIYRTGSMSSGLIPFRSWGNEIKADQELTAGADPAAIESPVELNSSNSSLRRAGGSGGTAEQFCSSLGNTQARKWLWNSLWVVLTSCRYNKGLSGSREGDWRAVVVTFPLCETFPPFPELSLLPPP